MMKVAIDKKSLAELHVAALHFESLIPRHLRAAVNKVSKTVRVQIAKELGRVMHLKNNFEPGFKKAETLKRSIKAKSMATTENPEARLGFGGGYPFAMKYFDARIYTRTKKGKKENRGVKVRLTKAVKGNNGTRILQDAFIRKGAGGKFHVFRRLSEKSIRPIVRVDGPSPGDFYNDIQAIPRAKRIAAERLPIEIKRRVRAILLEKRGILKLRASRGI